MCEKSHRAVVINSQRFVPGSVEPHKRRCIGVGFKKVRWLFEWIVMNWDKLVISQVHEIITWKIQKQLEAVAAAGFYVWTSSDSQKKTTI